MIDFRKNELLIVNGLQEWLAKKGYDCPVIMANQAAPIPAYPYISYTAMSVISNAKGYSIGEDGTRYKPMVQSWSFTIQADDDVVAMNVAMEAYDWFALSGNTYLSDNQIVVQRVGNVTNRDNLISVEYEYRQGFDVELLLMFKIIKEDSESAGYINAADITHDKEV